MNFYFMSSSPPCRAVIMTAKAVGVNLKRKWVSTLTGEQLKPEFVKINPQHTLPTIVDNGFVLWESRAIMIYLVEKYGKNDDLYPKCPQKQAVINQWFYFDMALYQKFLDYYAPKLLDQPGDPEKFKAIEAHFKIFDTLLEDRTYVAGDTLTLADISLLATISLYDVVKFDFGKYPNVAKWYSLVDEIAPGSDENRTICAQLKVVYKKKLDEWTN